MTLPRSLPTGQYSHGAFGPNTVLVPRCYGTVNSDIRVLLDDITEISGTNRFNLTKSSVARSSHGCTQDGGKDHAELEHQAAMASMAAVSIPIEGFNAGVTRFLSPVVSQSLLGPMESIGVYNINHMGEFMEHSPTEGLMMKQNAKGHVFFTPLMVRQGEVSWTNNHNQGEFITQPDGSLEYNHNFWDANLELKQLRNGSGTFATIDIGMVQPPWTIPESHRQTHNDAIHKMDDIGPILPGTLGPMAVLLTLKRNYAYVFTNTMKSNLVVKAKKAGFSPLWLMKYVLLQKCGNFGVNGWQFSSLDKQPKSYLSLAGFYKGTVEDGNLTIITLTNAENEFLSIEN